MLSERVPLAAVWRTDWKEGRETKCRGFREAEVQEVRSEMTARRREKPERWSLGIRVIERLELWD